MDEDRFSAPVTGIEYRSNGGDAIITGYAAVFDELSVPLGGFRERIQAGAFRASIEGGADVKALVDHDPSKILGRTKAGTLTVQEDKRGLKVEIRAPRTTSGTDILESIRRGDVDQMSFAFLVPRGGDEWDDSDPNDIIRTLKEVELRDVSIVTDPAYPQTVAKLAQRDLKTARAKAKGVLALARLDKAGETIKNTTNTGR